VNAGNLALIVRLGRGAGGPICADGDARICDVRLQSSATGDRQASAWILTSDGKFCEFDVSLTHKHRELTLDAAESFVLLPADSTEAGDRLLVVRSDGGLTLLVADGSSQNSFTFGSLKVNRICPAPELAGELTSSLGTDRIIAYATALDERGQWVAVGINAKLEAQWTHRSARKNLIAPSSDRGGNQRARSDTVGGCLR